MGFPEILFSISGRLPGMFFVSGMPLAIFRETLICESNLDIDKSPGNNRRLPFRVGSNLLSASLSIQLSGDISFIMDFNYLPYGEVMATFI